METALWIAVGTMATTLGFAIGALLSVRRETRTARMRATERVLWDDRYRGHLCSRCLTLLPDGPEPEGPSYCDDCAPHRPVAS